MSIQTVKSLDPGYGYLVNGNMGVPNDPGNSHYQEILKQVEAGTLTIADAE